MLVTIIVPGQDNQFRAQLPRPNRRHGGVNAELPGFVGGRCDDAAFFTADGDGLAAQARVRRLLDRGKECVRVQMDDGFGRQHGSFPFADQGDHDALDHQFASGKEFGIFGVLGAEMRLALVGHESFERAFSVN